MRKLLLATTAMVLLWVSPAIAGPLITGLGALMSTAIGATGATVGSVLGGVALSLGSSYLFGAIFGPETKQRGVKSEVEFGAGLPPAFIFGTYATPGVMLYENVFDGGDDIPNQCLVQVIGLSFLPVKGIQSMLIAQDERVNIDLSSNHNGFKHVNEYVKGAGGGGYFLVKFLDGTQDAVDPWLLDKFGDHPLYPIHEDCWWRGCALVIIQAWYSNRGVWTGWPETKWVVEGIPLYDPRKDSTVGGSGAQRLGLPATWGEAPSNAKVIEYNFILGIKYKGAWQWGGKNTDPYRLPLSYWFAAMNACDEEKALAGGGTVKVGHIGGEIRFDDDPREIIAEINKSVNGYTTLSGGFYKTWCGAPGLPVMTITDDDFVITQDRNDEYSGKQEIYNTGYGYYPDPRDKWQMKDSPRVVNPAALAEDGVEKALDVQFPFLTHWRLVQGALRAMINDSRDQVAHRGRLPPEAFVLEPFDRVNYVSAREGYGGAGKGFKLDAKEDLANVQQDVLLREINYNDDGWLPAAELDDPVGNSGNIVAEEPNLGLVLTADEVTLSGGRERPAIKITWPWAAQDTNVRRIYWKIRVLGTSKVIANGDFGRFEDGEYFLVHPALRYSRDYEITFKFVYHTPRFTNFGSWGAISMLPAIPDAPTSLTAVGRQGRIVLKTTKSTDPTFDHWNVYASSTNDFTTATLIDTPKGTRFVEDDLGNGVTRYYWITPENKWWTEGPKFPVSNTGGRTATTVRVGDDDIDTAPPSTPTISMTGFGGDYDDDGTIDAGLALTITNPNTGTRITDYMVTIQRSPNDGPGTYVDWRELTIAAADVADSLITVLQREANSKFWYRARVRAIGFNKRKGSNTTYTTPVKPNKYAGYAAQSVAAPSVVRIANGYIVTASLGSMPAALFKEMEILVGGVTLIKVPALTYQDMTARAVGATPSYTVKLYDKVGGVTNVSSATVAAAFRAATASEVGVLTGSNLGAGAVTTPALASEAVTAAKWLYEDETSIIRNPNMDDISLFAAAATGGTISSFTTSGQASSGGVSKNALSAAASGGTTKTKVMTLPDIPVRPGFMYRVEGYVGPAVAAITPRVLRAEFYTMDASGNLVFDSGADLIYPGTLPGGPLGPYGIYGDVIVPANCVRMALGGVTDGASCVVHSLSAQRKTVSSADNLAVGPTGSFGTTEQTLVTVSLPHGDGVKLLHVQGSLKNVAGATKTATIRIRINGGEQTFRQNVDIRDNQFQDISCIRALPGGPTSTITLTYEGAAGANNVSQAWLHAVAIS